MSVCLPLHHTEFKLQEASSPVTRIDGAGYSSCFDETTRTLRDSPRPTQRGEQQAPSNCSFLYSENPDCEMKTHARRLDTQQRRPMNIKECRMRKEASEACPKGCDTPVRPDRDH